MNYFFSFVLLSPTNSGDAATRVTRLFFVLLRIFHLAFKFGSGVDSVDLSVVMRVLDQIDWEIRASPAGMTTMATHSWTYTTRSILG